MIHRFNRFELKYVLHAFQVEPLLRDILPYVRRDPHAGTTGFYKVVSLYYDSPDVVFYREKIDGLSYRRKLRMRVYPDGTERSFERAMVEIKQRVDRTVQKRRIRLVLALASDLCAGRVEAEELEPQDRPVAEEVRSMVSLYRLRPVCVVSYIRRAFVGSRYDRGLRITVDTDVSARVHGLDVTSQTVNHRILSPSCCILEVKVDEKMPRWLAGILAAHNVSIERVSKYCAGLERCTRLRSRELEMFPTWTNS